METDPQNHRSHKEIDITETRQVHWIGSSDENLLRFPKWNIFCIHGSGWSWIWVQHSTLICSVFPGIWGQKLHTKVSHNLAIALCDMLYTLQIIFSVFVLCIYFAEIFITMSYCANKGDRFASYRLCRGPYYKTQINESLSYTFPLFNYYFFSSLLTKSHLLLSSTCPAQVLAGSKEC